MASRALTERDLAGAFVLTAGGLWLNARDLSPTDTGLPNAPPPRVWVNLARVRWAMQSLPSGVSWTSAFRSAEVNAEVGGLANSTHLDGLALDVTPGASGLTMRELAAQLRASGAWRLVYLEDDHVHCNL